MPESEHGDPESTAETHRVQLQVARIEEVDVEAETVDDAIKKALQEHEASDEERVTAVRSAYNTEHGQAATVRVHHPKVHESLRFHRGER